MPYADIYFMEGVRRRYTLKESEKKVLAKRFAETFNVGMEEVIGGKPRVEVVELDDKRRIFIVNEKPLLIEAEGELIPTLIFEEILHHLPKVIVDMGAIPHICNGADIMAPGIVRLEGEFKRGDLAVILDERHLKSIAIVRALVDLDEAKSVKRGKVFENLHYVGDFVWNILRG